MPIKRQMTIKDIYNCCEAIILPKMPEPTNKKNTPLSTLVHNKNRYIAVNPSQKYMLVYPKK